MSPFEPTVTKPVITARRISRTYRLSPETLVLIQDAIEVSHFQTATALVEEAVVQFAHYVLKHPETLK